MKGDVVVVKVKPGDHVETGQVGNFFFSSNIFVLYF